MNQPDLGKEAERLNRHVEKKPATGPAGPVIDTSKWNITLSGFPTDPGAPVELLINGTVVFTSKADGSDVNENFTAEIAGFSGKNDVTLKVGALEGCVVNKKLSSNDGVFLKFEFTPKGLAFVQRTQPF
eukprot:TRINITY_DN3038_c0_g1_i1.p1 TRINITY_DN3038_c0_g1~~TRINITY_DN3038_c0_g1_i1.p1  ORF type:complete len:129 (-),score=37.97 TRINITY_DN3038_c0_g1_i1:107-493(-)